MQVVHSFVFANIKGLGNQIESYVRDLQLEMGRIMGKQIMWFPNRFDINQAVQAQKMARGWKFWI